MIPVGIPLFCTSKVPWELAGKFSAAKAVGSVSNLHVQCPSATPGIHHQHKEEERAKPGSCPLQTQPVGFQCQAQVLPPKLLLPALSLSQNSLVLHMLLHAGHSEQRASHGLSLWVLAGVEEGQHKEQHFGQEMEKRTLLDSPKIVYPPKAWGKASQ